MPNPSVHDFDCQLYVSGRQSIFLRLPNESGPRRLIRLRPVAYDELVEPGFRRLLAAFETVSAPAEAA